MTTENIANYLTSELQTIQSFMDANITAEAPMTAANIYAKIKGSLSKDINENVFKTSLSANIGLGNITGFRGRKRIGYCKIDLSQVTEVDEQELTQENTESETITLEPERKFIVQVTKGIRIVHSDKHNYTTQKLIGESWHNEFYNSSLGEAMRSTTKFLIKNGMKESPVVTQLKDAVKAFDKLESVILGQIMTCSKQYEDTDTVNDESDVVKECINEDISEAV